MHEQAFSTGSTAPSALAESDAPASPEGKIVEHVEANEFAPTSMLHTNGTAPPCASPANVPEASPTLPAQLTNLADYLASLSSIKEVRLSPAWKTFFTPGRDDHASARLEQRQVKRVKSESSIAHHTSSAQSTPRKSKKTAAVAPTLEEEETDASYLAEPEDSGFDLSASTSALLGDGRKKREAGGLTMSKSASKDSHMSIDTRPQSRSAVADAEVWAFMDQMETESPSSTAQTLAAFGSPSSEVIDAIQKAQKAEMDSFTQKRPGLLRDEVAQYEKVEDAVTPSEEPILQELAEDMSNQQLVAPAAEATPVEEAPRPLSIIGGEDSEFQEEGREDSRVDSADTACPEQQGPVAQSPTLQRDGERTGHLQEASDEVPSIEQEPSIRQVQIKRSYSRLNVGRSRRSSTRSGSAHIEKKVGIEDFDIIRVLGKGCAGKVSIPKATHC